MGNTRDLFKEIFHAKMGTVRDRTSKDLKETEDITKKWQENTEELYKEACNDLDNHDGVVTQVSSVQFTRSVMSDSLQPHELQHARPPCASPTPRVHPNSFPSSR